MLTESDSEGIKHNAAVSYSLPEQTVRKAGPCNKLSKMSFSACHELSLKKKKKPDFGWWSSATSEELPQCPSSFQGSSLILCLFLSSPLTLLRSSFPPLGELIIGDHFSQVSSFKHKNKP